MQACQDLLADGAAEAGFESFEETETGLEAYVQKDLFDKEVLDAYIADFPIEDTKITYEVKDAEDKDWNQEWEEQGFEPIYVDNQVVIYDAKHPELYPDTSNRPNMIEIGIEAKLAFGTGNHRNPLSQLVLDNIQLTGVCSKRNIVGQICFLSLTYHALNHTFHLPILLFEQWQELFASSIIAKWPEPFTLSWLMWLKTVPSMPAKTS